MSELPGHKQIEKFADKSQFIPMTKSPSPSSSEDARNERSTVENEGTLNTTSRLLSLPGGVYCKFYSFAATTNCIAHHVLATELRNSIYTYCVESDPISLRDSVANEHALPSCLEPLANSCRPRQFYALTQVCRKIRHEYAPLYFHTTQFKIPLDHLDRFPGTFLESATGYAPRNLKVLVCPSPAYKERPDRLVGDAWTPRFPISMRSLSTAKIGGNGLQKR
ncbi:hypothetical protein K491DRAFT_683787 [Lophiostoma macrostomum CBS 122681]|uniref:Uncharacterized protein n=1 Tax=Lophiostoma macrostomum CBS 122681 TaxID=1314788 RepID=A0A6A6SRA0_9PLEO|nr:hypothetical protein K491DRAFT_683787 [Lophiostoma macrostomum CBS 122681]